MKGGDKMPEQLHTTVHIDESRKVQPNAIIYALFGMTVDELAKEIRDNRDSKYDGIIVKEERAVV